MLARQAYSFWLWFSDFAPPSEKPWNARSGGLISGLNNL
ncbi:MAG: hypothetical protein QOJ40_77 [Verrucomicrobiota bacterium]